MSALLRALAGLPQIGGPLPVRVLPDGLSDGFCLIRTGNLSVEVAVLHDGSDHGRHEAEAYARLLSGAPVMLKHLTEVLTCWQAAIEQDREINGGDAVEWLGGFTEDVRDSLQALFGPPSAGTTP